MILHLLAQTTTPPASADAQIDWKFWVMAIIAIVCMFQTLFYPLIGWTMRQILTRLKDGDEKFEAIGQSQARMEVRVGGIDQTLGELRADLKEAEAAAATITVEGQGTVAELRVQIEREFVRKAELKDLERRMNDNHTETMNAINSLLRGKR